MTHIDEVIMDFRRVTIRRRKMVSVLLWGLVVLSVGGDVLVAVVATVMALRGVANG